MDESVRALAQRVEGLERTVLWWRRLACVVCAIVGTTVFLGAAASKKAKPQAEVQAQRLVLVDTLGKERAEFAMLSEHQPGLKLSDNDGRPRLTLSLTQHGEPLLSFVDASGTPRILMGLDLYGTFLRVNDDAGSLRATLAVPSEGEPELELRGKQDQLLWRAP